MASESGFHRWKGGRHQTIDRVDAVQMIECVGLPLVDEEIAFKEEVHMYLTDLIWWGYTAFVVVLALFMLFFAYKVTEKGD